MTEPIKPTQEGMYNCQFHTGGCLCHFNGYQQGQSAERAKWEKLKLKVRQNESWTVLKFMEELEKEPT